MLTFVLSGGGARGSYQAGALQALIEAGYRPDLLVGTSVGALNAGYLAVHGINAAGVTALHRAWRSAAEQDLLTARRAWLAAQALLQREDRRYYERLRRFFIDHGIDPDLRFGQLTHARLIVVATDLNHAEPVLFGLSPDDNVLDALLASAALPPWIPPIERGERLLTDGGLVSNLPIEPALRAGATEIIALDLADQRGVAPGARGVSAIISKTVATAAARQHYLEQALATAQGVPVRHMLLAGDHLVPIWDFSLAEEQIAEGYQIAREIVRAWDVEAASSHRPQRNLGDRFQQLKHLFAVWLARDAS